MTTIRTRSKSLRTGRRWLALATGVLVLQSLGCATAHSNRGGDPVLGSFNRPITPTPQPTGPGIGGPMEGPGVYAPPGVSADQLRPSEFPNVQLGGTPVNNALPGYTTAPYTPMSQGFRGAFGGEEPSTRRLPGGVRGATLMPPSGAMPAMTGMPANQPGNYPGGALTPAIPTNAPPRALPVYPGANSAPMPSSGLPVSFAPIPQPSGLQQVGYRVANQQPAPSTTVEDYQQMLRANGMRTMQLQQVENGEWYFFCSRGANPDGSTAPRYEARRPQAIDAVVSVIRQVSADMQAGR